MATADEVREQQRSTWNRFSAGWGKWDHLVLPMLEPIGVEMVRMLSIRDGDGVMHLDVASGTGEPGLTIAAAMPRGRVVLTDLAGDMLEIAKQAAAARSIDNVDFRICSADDLPFPDKTFDSISCRFGLMFFPDLGRAIAEFHRVLKPGGRISASVWAEPAGNPWASIPMSVIASEIDLPAPQPDAPGLYRYAAPGVIGAAFSAAGLSAVVETDVRSALAVPSVEEYWAYMTEVVAPVVAALDRADEATRGRIAAAVIERMRAFVSDGGLQAPLHARCIVATK